jgi:hypothetical protein
VGGDFTAVIEGQSVGVSIGFGPFELDGLTGVAVEDWGAPGPSGNREVKIGQFEGGGTLIGRFDGPKGFLSH